MLQVRSTFSLVLVIVVFLAGACSSQPGGVASGGGKSTLDRAAAARLLDQSLTSGPRYKSQGGKWDSLANFMGTGVEEDIQAPIEVSGITASGGPGASSSRMKATFTGHGKTGRKFSGEAYFSMYDDGWRLEDAYIMALIGNPSPR